VKTYISFSAFLATPNDTYPAYLPSGSQTWIYNSGTPRAQVSADSGEGVWADVGRADVRNHLLNVLQDIVLNYDIDGVIFDRIRYEHKDYGYNPVALSEMGIAGTPSTTDATFVDKRRDAVTTFLHDAYEAATNIKPWMIVGTVPIIYGTNFGDTYSDVFQFYPKWTARKTNNRVFSFGCQDCIQPQAYRSGATYGPYNSVYLDLMRYGDLSSYSLDFGLMHGANVNACPLFYHPSTADSAQSLLNAQNVCDARQKECNGSGLYSADTVRTDMHLIRTASTTPCGVDSFASMPPNADFLMKAGYDNTPPNAITGLAAVPNGSLGVALSWNAPTPATDGEGASRYLIYRGTTVGVKQYYATLRNKAAVVTATAYSDIVPASGSYYYKVVPLDDYNNRGTAVEIGPVSVTGAAASSAPAAPSNIRLTVFGNVVYVTWNDNSTNERNFELQRDSVTIATLSENVAAYTNDNVAAGSRTYRVRATNSFGNSSYVTASAVTAANTVAAPTGLSGSDIGAKAGLSWTDASTNESGMEILRGAVSGGPYTQLATISPGTTSFVDETATPGTHYYVVRAFNGTATSLYSNQATVTINALSPPNAPTGLSAIAAGASINLTWTDNSTNETGFEVRRATTAGGPYSTVQTVAANTTTFSDALTVTGTYYYVVRAYNAGGNSADTNEAGATVSAPAAPSGLSALVSGSNVNLTWTDNSNNESGFQVLRSNIPSGPYSLVGTTVANATGHADNAGSGSYYYVVRSFNGIAQSANSNEVSAIVTTPLAIIIESRQPGGALWPAPAYQEFLASGGAWGNTTAKSTAAGVTGLGGRYTGTSSVGSNAIFTPTITTPGYYNVYITLPNATSGPNNGSPGAGFLVVHDGTDVSGTFDLSRTNAAITDAWYLLAPNVKFVSGTGGYVKITNNNASSADTLQRFDMDAVKFEFTGPAAGVSDWDLR
jgi:hypothetical protein